MAPTPQIVVIISGGYSQPNEGGRAVSALEAAVQVCVRTSGNQEDGILLSGLPLTREGRPRCRPPDSGLLHSAQMGLKMEFHDSLGNRQNRPSREIPGDLRFSGSFGRMAMF